jgi:hypothetical protein
MTNAGKGRPPLIAGTPHAVVDVGVGLAVAEAIRVVIIERPARKP